MNNQKNALLVVFSFLILYSCGLRESDNTVLYQLFPDVYQDVVEVEGTVEAVHASTVACPQMLSGTVTFIVEEGTLVSKGDTVCILENEELANEYLSLQTDVEQSRLQLTKGKANNEMQFALLKAQVENNNAQTSITKLSESQLQYLSPQQRRIKELELEKAAIEKKKIQKKLALLKKINESELKKLELRIKQKENRAARIKERLDQLIITTPQDGMATRAVSWMTGEKVQETDQCWGGMPLVQIPDMSEMKVVIKAPEAVYKRISEKDSLVYSFNAQPGNFAYGKITRKAPMGKPISRKSKVKYFEITASIDSCSTMPDLGLSANCIVILSEIRDTIVVPQIAVFDEDTARVVYVKQGRIYEKREVLLAESSPKKAVVSLGLNQNEVIAFERPASSRVKSAVYLPDSLKAAMKEVKPVEKAKPNQSPFPGKLPGNATIITK